MDDRELLELAAKSVGGVVFESLGGLALTTSGMSKLWNPLIDDADAFRLAVKLAIQIDIYLPTDRDVGQTFTHSHTLLGYGSAGYPSYQASEIFSENHEQDPYAATRRAIVRAAAEIGRAM